MIKTIKFLIFLAIIAVSIPLRSMLINLPTETQKNVVKLWSPQEWEPQVTSKKTTEVVKLWKPEQNVENFVCQKIRHILRPWKPEKNKRFPFHPSKISLYLAALSNIRKLEFLNISTGRYDTWEVKEYHPPFCSMASKILYTLN